MTQPERDRLPPLHPPIYRRMLAADDPLQMSQTTLFIAIVASLVSAIIGEAWFVLHDEKPIDLLGVAVRAIFIFANALLLAQFIARWLGSRAATAAVFAFCSTLSVVLGIAGNLLTFCLIGTIYCFARQGIAGRLPVDESVKTQWATWLLIAFLILGYGYQSGVVVVVIGIGFSLISQNGPLLKRFFHPLGLVIIGTSVAISLWFGIPVVWADDSYLRILSPTLQLSAIDFVVLLLPWWPMFFVTIYLGIRHGHYAEPLFQLVAVWFLVTVLAITFGILPSSTGLAAITPPLVLAVASPLRQIPRLVARRR